MADNLALWNKVSRPPREALKQIKGGRLSGMTDVNPQWRFKAMTEQFGRCGLGWHYTIDKLWTEPGTDGQMVAFAMVSLFAGEAVHPVHGIGGSMLIQKETAGLRTNIEQPGVETFQRSFPQDPGKFCTPFCTIDSQPVTI